MVGREGKAFPRPLLPTGRDPRPQTKAVWTAWRGTLSSRAPPPLAGPCLPPTQCPFLGTEDPVLRYLYGCTHVAHTQV